MRNLRPSSMKKTLFIIALILLTSILSTKVFAQSFESISFQVTPENPAPGELVHILLQSYSIDVDQSKITWYAAGKKVLEGTGRKELVTLMPSTGGAVAIEAVLVDKNKKTVTQDITISPASLDLVWEAIDSYTPVFYKGKALPGEESVVRVVAMPTSQQAIPSSNTTTYNWVRNGSNMPLVSGSGRNVYTIKLDPFNSSEEIGVTSSTGSQTISIVPTPVQLLLYAVNPLYGTQYNTALTGAQTPNTQEISITAEPFFFSPNNKFSDTLLYTWLVNGFPVGIQTDPTTLTLRGTDSSQSGTNISLEVSNKTKTLQKTTSNLKINFK